MDDLHRYLVEHPAFIWLLGFPLTFSLSFHVVLTRLPVYPHHDTSRECCARSPI